MSDICSNPPCGKECPRGKVCAKCKAATYCSRDCQVAHWKRHKKICGSLNPNVEAQQLNHADHEDIEILADELYPKLVAGLSRFPQPCRDIYRLFMETPKEEDQAKLHRRVKQQLKLARRIPRGTKEEYMFHALALLIRASTWRIKKPTSPLLILFQTGVNADALSTDKRTHRTDEHSYTCLCQLAQLSSTSHERYNRNQVILGRQFIEQGGADVNARSNVGSCFPLYNACSSQTFTNPDFIRLLLENGADPNQQQEDGYTPLMNTLSFAVGAAKLLLTYEHENALPIDVNVRCKDGRTGLDFVNETVAAVRRRSLRALSGDGEDSSEAMNHLLKQVLEMSSLLQERGAVMGDPAERKLPTKQERPDRESWPGRSATPLDYDVSCLFGKDLQRDKGIPEWQKDIWINDDESIQYESHERKPHLHSNRSRDGGRTPEVGLRIKLTFHLPNKSEGVLEGKVVEVFPAPTDKKMRRNGSFMLGSKCDCNKPECTVTKTGKRKDILAMHGALHGQEVKGTVKLSKAMKRDAALAAFFGTDTKYDVVLRCNDKQQNMWFLARIDPHELKADENC